jgi:histidyl-tRNA synthetase
LVLARELRRSGLGVELDASGSAFGKQFKRADRSGAAWAAVLGEGELERGVVLLKPLRGQDAEEMECPLADQAGLLARVKPVAF